MKFAKALVMITVAAVGLNVMTTGRDASAGAVSGPQSGTDRLGAQQRIYYDVMFRANEFSQIVVRGDGSSDLDLYVYDEQGNLICSDQDGTDICKVSFQAYFTTTFRIYVVNAGNRSNSYQIETN